MSALPPAPGLTPHDAPVPAGAAHTPTRHRLRSFALSLSLGALVGFVLWSMFGPRLIGWWHQPPSGDPFACGVPIANALGSFVKLQLIAAVSGGVLMLILGWLLRALWRRITGRRATAAHTSAMAVTTPAPHPEASPPDSFAR